MFCIILLLSLLSSFHHGRIDAFRPNVVGRRTNFRTTTTTSSSNNNNNNPTLLFVSYRSSSASNSNKRTPNRSQTTTNRPPSHQQNNRRKNHRDSFADDDDGDNDDFYYEDERSSLDDDVSVDNKYRGGQRKNVGSSSPQRRQKDEVEITDTNAHFFSKKSLNDPTFQLVVRGEDDDDKAKSLHKRLCDGAGITRPSRIQSLAWPSILEGKHVILGDQTGSGKTLAYLLPLLQRALLDKQLQSLSDEKGTAKKNGSPRLLVLAPTAELADQIRDVCYRIAQTVPFNTMVITASGKQTTSIRDQIRMIQRQPMDVLISTPGRIATILRTKNSGLDLMTNLQAIVLDEVDILMIDETFGPQLRTVGAAAPPLEKTQFVFVTATLPDTIVDTVQKEFPGVVQIRGPGLHRLAPSLKEHLVDVSVASNQNRDEDACFDVKAKALLSALRQNRCRRTLVFCNTVESCRQVENLLNRKDRRGKVLEVLAYHNAMTPENRNNNLEVFANGRRKSVSSAAETSSASRRKSVLDRNDDVDYVLVCTDRAARGVDFDASPVDHIVIFDFPKDPAEYIRRVGRTARAGRTGTSTVFAYGWQLPIARKVMGSKIDSFSIASTENVKDNDDDYAFRKQKPRRSQKSQEIASKIQSGELWE
jgi:ATP-dependent RNA helicase DDX18/HAS1